MGLDKEITNGTAVIVNIAAVLAFAAGFIIGFLYFAGQQMIPALLSIVLGIVISIMLFGLAEIIHLLTNINERVKD